MPVPRNLDIYTVEMVKAFKRGSTEAYSYYDAMGKLGIKITKKKKNPKKRGPKSLWPEDKVD